MGLLDASALMLTLAAVFGWFNHRFLRLPFAIGLLISGLLASLGVLAVDAVVPELSLAATVGRVVLQIDFAETVLSGMLSVLLFAGALHTDLSQLRERIPPIVALASIGVLISAAAAGLASYHLFRWLGTEVGFVWCLAFGALISPTDPIAVLGIMRAAKAPKHVEVKVIGESLFNDGTGVVLFTILVGVGVATTGSSVETAETLSVGGVTALLVKEILGGIVLGLAAGYLCHRAFRTLNEPNLEVLMTVATVFVIGVVAIRAHLSAPLAAVAAGLFIGNRRRMKDMSAATAQHLDVIWTFIDETLNAVLFLLIGLEVFAIDTRWGYLVAGLALIPLVLGARFMGVAIPVFGLRMRQEIGAGTVRMLTWGGLKGGVSVALAMKLPPFEGRDIVLTVTYVVVVFSIVIQGLTVGRLIRRLYPAVSDEAPAEGS